MIFSFLTDLAKNNNKEWFDAHKEAYECAKLEATLLFNYIYILGLLSTTPLRH